MAYEKVTLGPAYSIRLNDLSASDVVKTTCMGCGKRWYVAPHRLYSKYRAHTWLRYIADFFICKDCGCKRCYWEILRAYHPEDRKKAETTDFEVWPM